MNIRLAYGKSQAALELDERRVISVLEPNELDIGLTGEDEVRRALSEPVGAPPLSDIVRPGERIAIITSDVTRPMPSYIVLPPLLERLELAGARRQDITIVFALGSHRGHTEAEKRRMVGDAVYDAYHCVDSDPDDCVSLGVTSRGTPVDIFRSVAEADRRILLGNIEYHYFAGYSGGMKAIMPGVSTRAAIQSNHSAMVKAEAAAGRLDGNPVREDIEEVARFLPADYILNVVLDEGKRIIKAMAGHPVLAHREGCAFLDRLYKVRIPRRAEIVIVSPGGYPKDINLYQAQKALDNAKHAVADGGVVILLADCPDGLGEGVFERWMTQAHSPADMVRDIQRRFELGGHKAAAIALVLERARIFLVSGFSDEKVKQLFMEPYPSVQAAYDAAVEALGREAGVIVMPYGGSTLPCE